MKRNLCFTHDTCLKNLRLENKICNCCSFTNATTCSEYGYCKKIKCVLQKEKKV